MAAQESMETRRSDQQEDAESMPVVVRFEKKPQADDAGAQTWKERERDLLEVAIVVPIHPNLNLVGTCILQGTASATTS